MTKLLCMGEHVRVHMFFVLLDGVLSLFSSLCVIRSINGLKWGKCTIKVELDNWTKETCNSGNDVEMTNFGIQYLHYPDLSVCYYLSIRSGNWHLRKACLKSVFVIFKT